MLISTKELKEAIQNAMLSTTKEKESPLYNVLLEIKDRKLTAKSQNNITRITYTAETEGKGELSILTEPQKLFNILKEINEESVNIEKEENTVIIQAGSFKTRIKTLNPQLYPEIKESVERQKICTIDAEKLKKLIKNTVYCPDKNDIAREYTGIFFEFKDNTIKATATDHYRLINITTESEIQKETEFIIENSGATLINRIPLEGEVDVYLSENEVSVESDNLKITSKLIKGSFPDYNQILLDKDTSNTIELERESFKEAVKRSSTLSENREITLNISLKDKILTLSSQNQEGEVAEDQIELSNIGANDNLVIKLDSKFILDFIGQITSETVTMVYRTAEEPVMFETSEEGFSYKYIMTPIIE